MKTNRQLIAITTVIALCLSGTASAGGFDRNNNGGDRHGYNNTRVETRHSNYRQSNDNRRAPEFRHADYRQPQQQNNNRYNHNFDRDDRRAVAGIATIDLIGAAIYAITR